MNHILNTEIINKELNDYLSGHNYFEDVGSVADINHQITAAWKDRLKEALSFDFMQNFDTLTIDIYNSQFDLSDENSQGSPCLFFHQAILYDKEISESLKLNIKTFVAYNKTDVYLDSDYANSKEYSGKSKVLKRIFKQLKTSDEKPGYFQPVNLKALLHK